MLRWFSTRSLVLCLAAALCLPALAAAQKVQPLVTGTWQNIPAQVTSNANIGAVLRVRAATAAPAVTVELVPSDGLAFDGPTTWSGALDAGATLDLPVTVRVVRDGDWTLGARITSVVGDVTQVSGAVMHVSAAAGSATLGADDPAVARMAQADSPASQSALGIGVANTATLPDAPRIAAPVSGTVVWTDPAGLTHPIRFAYIEISTGTGTLLTRTSTNASGVYSASVDATDIRVTVFSRDLDGTRVAVSPLGNLAANYVLQSPVTVFAGAATINITAPAIVAGTPGAPSTDSLPARAFAVYDAMLTYWSQATALIGRNMDKAVVNFPESMAPGAVCGTSCYSGSSTPPQMYILREDALDWDVTGHEFFHFTTNRGALRTIDSSPGGYHNGGSAIGQNSRGDGTGYVRNRDQGMKLAWSEGLATTMALLLQEQPPSAVGFPNLAGIADGRYTDTEDATSNYTAEAPPTQDGFGSENSVIGILWDLYDTGSDGPPADNMTGVGASLLWGAVNSFLPCSPCDRLDRFWVGIQNFLGQTAPTTMSVAQVFALNKAAPVATPLAGSVSASVSPTFRWTRNGDPSSAHRNDQFFLVFSRDDFASHRVVIPVPTPDVTSYQPTDGEWQAVQAGADIGATYKWFVAAKRQDSPSIPEGWYWYSNVEPMTTRPIEAVITWSPLGADVDLHLANPSGTDIAYYNRTTSWGFLDRDCISDCTQEVISATSLPLPGAYRLFAHYYSDHSRGPATVHAVVRSGRAVIADVTFVLGATGATFTLASGVVGADQSIPPSAPAAGDAVAATSLPLKKQ